MNYKTAPAEKSTVKVTITYSKEEWDDAISKAYARTRGKFSVPGFRKGKAPKGVLESFYGKGVFFDEAFNIIFSASYPEIIAKEIGCIDKVDKLLTLEGLKYLYDLNSTEGRQ